MRGEHLAEYVGLAQAAVPGGDHGIGEPLEGWKYLIAGQLLVRGGEALPEHCHGGLLCGRLPLFRTARHDQHAAQEDGHSGTGGHEVPFASARAATGATAYSAHADHVTNLARFSPLGPTV
ncbi:hypothetical protein ACFYMI_01595 [Streptomyces collinus]|uniref:hypothetical protein n=1 Tax=Streptomyces collinus TaxID=42684 RepID=UPI00369CE597